MILSFLYRIAGVDQEQLLTCPHSERVKLASMGILIFSLSTITFFVFLYMTFKIMASEGRELGYSISIVLSLFVSLIVFNMYRLILTSAGYGDGTFRVQWREIVSSFAPWLTAALFGVCLGIVITVLVVQGVDGSQGSYEIELIQVLHDEAIASDLQSLTSSHLSSLTFFEQVSNIAESDDYQFVLIIFISLGVLLYSLPIILKLVFWRKGPYEYQIEFHDTARLAKYGVVPKAYKFTHGKNIYFKPRYMHAEKLLKQKLAELGVQAR